MWKFIKKVLGLHKDLDKILGGFQKTLTALENHIEEKVLEEKNALEAAAASNALAADAHAIIDKAKNIKANIEKNILGKV